MDYRNLGRAGLKVSEICLGTMTFGNGADQDEARRMVDAALEAGVNFFDTANSYVGGTSETMLGEALKGKRHDAVIATKVFNPMGDRPNDSGMSRLHIKQQIEGVLKRLQTDYIDIFFIHHVDHSDAARGDAARLRRSRARGQGALHRLLELRGVAPDGGAVAQRHQRLGALRLLPAAIQPGGARHRRGDRAGLRAQGPGLRGLVAARPAAISPASTRRAASRCRARARPRAGASRAASSRPTMPRSCRRCSTSRKEIGSSPAQVALRWVMDQPFMTSAIVGARNAEQLGETLKAGGWRLPAEALDKLNKVSAQP